ncbi:hypothetical protein BDQ17DRAFT_1430601 [Cyathus striatus]|nr:hypothetical protein BDQ17DRAFT_1430601 [Cyathus striatus]
MLWLSVFLTLLPGLVSTAIYERIQNSTGIQFFYDWNFVTKCDDSDCGQQTYLDDLHAKQHLALSHTPNGHIILKADNTTSLSRQNRHEEFGKNRSKATFHTGSVWIVDIFHSPYGRGVQPVIHSHGSFSSLQEVEKYLKSEEDPEPFLSSHQGNINVVHNPMHVPPRLKLPIAETAMEFNTGSWVLQKKRDYPLPQPPWKRGITGGA